MGKRIEQSDYTKDGILVTYTDNSTTKFKLPPVSGDLVVSGKGKIYEYILRFDVNVNRYGSVAIAYYTSTIVSSVPNSVRFISTTNDLAKFLIDTIGLHNCQIENNETGRLLAVKCVQFTDTEGTNWDDWLFNNAGMGGLGIAKSSSTGNYELFICRNISAGIPDAYGAVSLREVYIHEIVHTVY